ncbi:hypothetical protein AN948_01875 [Rhodococcus sp. ADH]|uniref:hypothetical protein n=2 Tax=unclassified Rhodococcus (in: high G+C Gram-positive bacteria) TaxID=192944 RepID=UPI0006BA4FB9|nr:hypothetical protein AN948_01875 [Rhodococcus sp. ADH]
MTAAWFEVGAPMRGLRGRNLRRSVRDLVLSAFAERRARFAVTSLAAAGRAWAASTESIRTMTGRIVGAAAIWSSPGSGSAPVSSSASRNGPSSTAR